MVDLFGPDEIEGDGLRYRDVKAAMASEGGAVDVAAIKAQIEDLYRGFSTIGVSRADWEAIWAALAAAEGERDELKAVEVTIGGADKATLARKLRRRNAAFEAVRKERKELRAALSDVTDAYCRTVRHHERDPLWPRERDLDAGADIVRAAWKALGVAALTGPPAAPSPQEGNDGK